MPVGENAESRARKAIDAQDPKQGQEMQQVQALQSSIQEIQGERNNNLMAARMGAEGDARENQAMLQAAEMGMLGGAAGGAVAVENATPIQQTSPQTQAILSKYGVGKPKNQRVTTRNVQQTPTKITINNNTTNNTTNNVAVPAANVGGPVQGRTLAIKQQPDQGQARFKTWISNAFARQNQAAAQREKEYQRREWSLSRTTGKLMKKLQELGTTISERMDPRKIASSATNHFKTLLFLFGTMFLAKNWERVIRIGSNIERFFFGEVDPKNPEGKRGEPGFKILLKELFGAKEGQTVGEAIKNFFWNDSTSETGKDAGIFNILLKKLKDYFSEGAAAVKSLELPKLDTHDIIGSIKSLVGYLGNVLSALFTGGEGLKDAIDSQVKETGDKSKYGFNSRGEDTSWIDDRVDINKKFTNYKIKDVNKAYGIDASDGNIAYGDVIHTRDKDSTNYLRYIDLDKEGNLTGTVGSGFRATNSVVSMLKDEDTVNTVGVTSMLGRIETAVKKSESEGKNGLAVESGDFFSTTGLTPGDVEELKKTGEIKEGKFKYIVREKTKEELAQELSEEKKENISPEMAALNAGLRTKLENVTGIGSLTKMGYTVLGAAGGMLLCLVPGGQVAGIPLLTAAITGGTAGYLVGSLSQNEAVRAGEAAILNTKKARVIPRYKVELVPASDPRPGLSLGKNSMSTTTVAKNPKDQTIVDGFWIKSGVINKIKDRIGGFKTKDAEGNEIYKSFDITDAEVRKHMDDFTRSTQMQLHGKIAENADYDLTNYKGVEKLDKLREQHKKEQAEMWDNSQVKRGVDYVTEGVNSAIDTVSGYISHNNYTNVPLREPEKLSKGEYRDRIIKTMEFAMNELGMTKEQAAGLAGNFMRESSMTTTARNPSPSAATGLAQWLGVRKAAFEHSREFTENEKSSGWKYYDGPGSGKPLANASFEEQLKFVKWEMENIPSYREGLKKIKQSKDHKEAAANVFGYYEFSAGPQGAVKAMNESNQDGLGSLNKGINFAGDALLAYNTVKGEEQSQTAPMDQQSIEDTSVQPDISGTYITQNTLETPRVTEYGVEFNGQTYNPEFAQNLGSFDISSRRWNWGENNNALAMADNASKPPIVTPESSRQVSGGINSGSTNSGSPTLKTADQMSSSSTNNTDNLLTGINTQLTNLNTLTAAASDQQVQATMTIAQAIGNMQITISNEKSPQTSVSSWGSIPGSNET